MTESRLRISVFAESYLTAEAAEFAESEPFSQRSQISAARESVFKLDPDG
jgi:hypothetical protein